MSEPIPMPVHLDVSDYRKGSGKGRFMGTVVLPKCYFVPFLKFCGKNKEMPEICNYRTDGDPFESQLALCCECGQPRLDDFYA